MTVMVREEAWKPRWVVTILTNSVAKSTVDNSREPESTVPKLPSPGLPSSTGPESFDSK